MKLSSFAIALNLCQIALSAPIVITRQHTADAVTVTDTYSTSTNTVTAPTVEIFVSNGVTYTYTLTDATSFAEPTTFTSVFNDNVDPVTAASTTTLSPTTSSEAAETTSSQAAETTSSQAAETTSSQAAETTSTSENNSDNNAPSYTASPTTYTTSVTSTTSYEQTLSEAEEQTTSSSTPTSTSTSATSSSVGTLNSVPSAITYSPYNNDGSCKDSASVKKDLELIQSTGITSIRIYGTDCNSIETVLPNAVTLGLKVNQGFWFTSDGASSIDSSVTALIAYGKENTWDVFDFITVGNEAVQSKYLTVSELIAKISSVKSLLSDAGYSGKITTSEPPVTFEQNSDLCTQSKIDFVGINPHSYFDTSSSADQSGSFVKGQVAIVAALCGGKDIVVTETGYPHSGIQNGKNIPSVANQKLAVGTILKEMGNSVTILSTFNDYWKQPGDYGIEQSFGSIQLF